MASFPGAVKTFASRSNGSVIDAAHVGDLQDEVTAIEDGLRNGTAPLNSSNSTFAALSIAGGSTHTGVTNLIGAIQLNSSYGTQGQLLVSGGSSGATWGNSIFTSYTATLQNVIGSTGNSTLVSFTVPGGAMASGDVIDIHLASLMKNSGAGATTPVYKVAWGTSVSSGFSPTSWGDPIGENKQIGIVRMQRVGSDLWIRDAGNMNAALLVATAQADGIAAPTFSSDQTVALMVVFGSSNSSLYHKPQAAKVTKF